METGAIESGVCQSMSSAPSGTESRPPTISSGIFWSAIGTQTDRMTCRWRTEVGELLENRGRFVAARLAGPSNGGPHVGLRPPLVFTQQLDTK